MTQYTYRVEKILLFSHFWQNSQCVTWTQKHKKLSIRISFTDTLYGKIVCELTCNENRAWSTGLDLPSLDPYNRGAIEWRLSCTVRVRRPKCVTTVKWQTIGLMGRRTTNLDRRVFTVKFGAIYSLTSLNINVPKMVRISCQIEEIIGNVCSQYHHLVVVATWVTFGPSHAMKMMSNPMIWLDRFWPLATVSMRFSVNYGGL